jgi:hypothetical protein
MIPAFCASNVAAMSELGLAWQGSDSALEVQLCSDRLGNECAVNVV